MDFIQTILKRRSVRRYTGGIISQEALQAILTAGMMTPSSRNLRSTELIVVTGKEALSALASAKAGGTMLESASHAIVVIGNSQKSDAWIEDSSIAMTQMMLMAAELGLGTCWIHCRNRESTVGVNSEQYVKELLDIPEAYSVLSILSIGVPVSAPAPRDISEMESHKIHYGKF